MTVMIVREGKEQEVEVFIGHGDLLWSNDFPTPRFGLGAFSLAFQTLYKAYTGMAPVITHFGKPTALPFKSSHLSHHGLCLTCLLLTLHCRLVETLLQEQGESLNGEKRPLEQIFMVGDNPAADVRGARNAGAPWIAVLVETGVFHTSSLHANATAAADPADRIAKDVLNFIDTVL